MATTLSITGLTDYVKNNADELFVKSVLGAKSLDFADLYTNVKYKEALNYLDSEINLQDGSECGFDPDGSDVFSERFIEVHPIKVNKSWCSKDFRKKIQGLEMQWEAGRINIPVDQKLAESNMNRIQEAVEDLVWQGDAELGVTGWIADLEAESASTIAVEFASGQTVSEKVDAMVAAVPMRALKKGVNLFLSYTDFRAYVAEANSTCCANRPIIDAASETIKYVGDSRIAIVPVIGLEGTGAMVAAAADNLCYGTDIEGSENVYKMWLDDKTDEVLFKVDFLAGTAIKFPDEAVLGE